MDENHYLKVLALTWEFPPIISGGLGMACYGLIRSLLRQNVEVLLVLPTSKPVFFHLIKPDDADQLNPVFLSRKLELNFRAKQLRTQEEKLHYLGVVHHYDLYVCKPDPYRYRDQIRRIYRNLHFDLIHAHDWFTYPAGMYLKEVSGKPLICHVHSTEFDRAGGAGDPSIYQIEREGLQVADSVISVSRYNASHIVNRYCIDPAKIRVIHNAYHIERDDKAGGRVFSEPVVLFLGRITRQKGPDIFLEVARRVLRQLPQVRFVMAGDGDMKRKLLVRSAHFGMGTRFLFTGFLDREDVGRILSAADIIVVPSVSEPFGITVLEAMSRGVTAIVSTNSGVLEIVRNAIRVDFQDADRMASMIIALITHPQRLRRKGKAGAEEVQKISWEKPGEALKSVYKELVC